MSWPIEERAGDMAERVAFVAAVRDCPRYLAYGDVPVYPGRWGAGAPVLETVTAPSRASRPGRWARVIHHFQGQS